MLHTAADVTGDLARLAFNLSIIAGFGWLVWSLLCSKP